MLHSDQTNSFQKQQQLRHQFHILKTSAAIGSVA
jgi:hypothetical protein